MPWSRGPSCAALPPRARAERGRRSRPAAIATSAPDPSRAPGGASHERAAAPAKPPGLAGPGGRRGRPDRRPPWHPFGYVLAYAPIVGDGSCNRKYISPLREGQEQSLPLASKRRRPAWWPGVVWLG